MDAVDIWSVMKWVLLVLLAGFIAQFGKVMAQSILKKVGKVKPPAAVSPAEQPVNLSSSPQHAIVTSPADLKTGDGENAPQMTTAVTDKKLIKAMVKQKKKEHKSS
jgi:hypothetical protein